MDRRPAGLDATQNEKKRRERWKRRTNKNHTTLWMGGRRCRRMDSDGRFLFCFSMAGKSSGQKQSNLVLAGLYWRCDQWPAPEEDPLLTPACFSILALELLPWNAIDQRLLAWPFLPPPQTEPNRF